MKPKQYRAKDLKGNWVVGWYADLHLPHFDNNGNRIAGYDIIPSLFNDEEGERSKGSYWHTIDPATLEEVNDVKVKEVIQLELF